MIKPDVNLSYYRKTSKPFTRWWWFANPIEKSEITRQLKWVKSMEFGGVEIAWVYPCQQNPTTIRFLSREWAEIVAYARAECLRLDLACDFTFGTLWPFGGSFVSEDMASRTYKGLSEQRLQNSWEMAYTSTPGRILNHLDRKALARYAETLLEALRPALSLTPERELSPIEHTVEQDPCHRSPEFQNTPVLFCDSWEVLPEGLWTHGFGEAFYQRFGYHIEPFMDHLEKHPAERYDYCVLRAEYILKEFFLPFSEICHRQGALSRVQAHGAPTDILSAYAAADIPESEALLFDPEFSYIAASAATLSGKPVVTCEAFSCLYGWKPYPERGQFLKAEKTSDLKLLADALFASGVNHIIWHGMPYNTKGSGNEFYATVHVGPDGNLAKDLRDFNQYLETISQYMKTGSPLTEVAIYLPFEDMFMQGELPQARKKPSGEFYWELHDLRWPQELDSYHPTWVSAPFLHTAQVVERTAGAAGEDEQPIIRIDTAEFYALVVDVRWLAYETLASIARLAQEGAMIFIPTEPSEPGRVHHDRYRELTEKLFSLRRVHTGSDALSAHILGRQLPPLIQALDGNLLPLYRIRRTENTLICFFAHPDARGLTYPLPYGYAQNVPRVLRQIRVRIDPPVNSPKPVKRQYLDLTLDFAPNKSLLIEVDTMTTNTGYRFLDISYAPLP